jgi:hypothetical protein
MTTSTNTVTTQTSDDVVSVAGIVRDFGRVGRIEYATVKPIKANAMSYIVIGLDDSIEEGDYVEGTCIPDGRRLIAYDLKKMPKPQLTASKSADVRVVTDKERAAYGETMRAREAAQKLEAKADAAVSTPELAKA